jgi:hypothetical protein
LLKLLIFPFLAPPCKIPIPHEQFHEPIRYITFHCYYIQLSKDIFRLGQKRQ